MNDIKNIKGTHAINKISLTDLVSKPGDAPVAQSSCPESAEFPSLSGETTARLLNMSLVGTLKGMTKLASNPVFDKMSEEERLKEGIERNAYGMYYFHAKSPDCGLDSLIDTYLEPM